MITESLVERKIPQIIPIRIGFVEIFTFFLLTYKIIRKQRIKLYSKSLLTAASYQKAGEIMISDKYVMDFLNDFEYHTKTILSKITQKIIANAMLPIKKNGM